MPVKPLVSKIRVHNPNKRGSSKANTNYVTYIATREGVSLERVKDIDDLLQVDGILKGNLNETIVHQEAGNVEYMEYMAKRPRSHGLFGNIDTEDLKEVAREVAAASNEGKIIYRGIISLCSEDATNLGFKDAGSWYSYLKKVMPEIAKELGISTYDHTWVGAFHAEESHPHVHYELWDNRDVIKSPYIHVSQQNKIRKLLSEEMFDNEYEQSIRQVFEAELTELKDERNIRRKNILDLTSEHLVPGLASQKLPDRSKPGELKQLTVKLNELLNILPGKGRLNYKLLPPEAKEKLDEVVEQLLSRTDIYSEMEKYLNAVGTMQSLYGKTQGEVAETKKTAERDIRKRISNRILKEIKPLLLGGTDQSVTEQEKENFNPEGNSVPLQEEFADNGKWNEPVLPDEMELPDPEYYVEWNDSYKSAMSLLYDKEPDIQEAFDILEKEAINGNAIAINEVAKLIEREMTDVPTEEAVEYYREAMKAFKKVYATSRKEYIKAYAAYKIGKLYNTAKGNIEEPDYAKAVQWYEKAPENKYALYSLAKIYLSNNAFATDNQSEEENRKAAVDLLTKSEEKKNPFAAYELGNIYKKGIEEQSDAKKAAMYYEKALRGFLGMAQNATDDALLYRIGRMYLDGMGTEVNEKEGMKYIKQAASLKNENAILVYARHLYENEDLQEKDRAIKMLEKLENNALAEYQLAKIYLDQAGPVLDIEKAIEYLQRSADQENEYAQYKLGCIYADKEYAGYDMEKALDYLQRSAAQENQYAQYKLGCIYADKEYVGYDMEKALEYLQKSADQDNQYAQYKLGCIYADKEYAGYDMEKALGYLLRSADQENQYAQYKLGCIYADKEYTGYDIGKALDYLQKSAVRENQYAQCKLGMIYLFGKGVEKNKELAEYWLHKSADQGNIFAKDLLENRGFIGINVTYCLIKGVLQEMDRLQGQQQSLYEQNRLRDNKQAMKEYIKNRDGEQRKEVDEYGL